MLCFMEKLSDWLTRNDRTQRWLARQVGVSPITVTRWRTLKHTPALPTLYRIERLTNGEVPVAAWHTEAAA